MSPLMPFGARTWAVIGHDALAVLLAWLAAHWLYFGLALPPELRPAILAALVWVLPVQIGVFLGFGLHRDIWRHIRPQDFGRVALAAVLAALLAQVALLLERAPAPGAVLPLDALLLLVILAGSRLVGRARRERHASVPESARPALLLGVGRMTECLIREFGRSDSALRIVGLIDDSPDWRGARIGGIPVLGSLDRFEEIAAAQGVHDVFLAQPDAPAASVRNLEARCHARGIRLITPPSLRDVVLEHARPSDSERLEHLLPKRALHVDDTGLSELIGGAVVLVAGAGPVSAELCRQLAGYRPRHLLLLDGDETVLYRAEQTLHAGFPEMPVQCLLGDVKDRTRIDEIMRTCRPALVFHCLAEAPLAERGNAFQTMKNMVLGSWVMAKAARLAGVRKFVLVSNASVIASGHVLAAAQRLAEMLGQALQAHGLEQRTRYVSVRSGDLLEGGSLAVRLHSQIAAGGPVTLGHPEDGRHFVPLAEAARLILQAALLGNGGEVFVLDLGGEIRLAELAKRMIRLAGKTEQEVAIEFAAASSPPRRPDAHASFEVHPGVRLLAEESVDSDRVALALDWLYSTEVADDAEVLGRLDAWLPEFRRPAT